MVYSILIIYIRKFIISKIMKLLKGIELMKLLLNFEIKQDGEIVTCKMTNKKIEKVSIPKTGDTNNIFLYVIGVLVSGTLLLKMRSKKDKYKHLSVRYKLSICFFILFLRM